MKPNTIAVFWSRVDQSDGSDSCWEWQGNRKAGYGQFSWKSKTRQAHRMAWEFTYGSIPDGLDVLHRCDNPSCCNPDHLFLGTQADNNSDMCRKGRQVSRTGEYHGARTKPERVCRGEGHPDAKLNEAAVREIRRLARGGWSYRGLSRRFGVSDVAIRLAVLGKSWSHVT
jgi:hypothetical protein